MHPYIVIFTMKDGETLVYEGYARNTVEMRDIAERLYTKEPGRWLLDVDKVKVHVIRKRIYPGAKLIYGCTKESIFAAMRA